MRPLWWMRGPLFEENTGENGGGGAGTDKKDSGAFDPEAFKTSLLSDFDKRVNDRVNAALKNARKDWEKAYKPPEQKAEETKSEESTETGTTRKVDAETVQLRRDIEKMKRDHEALTTKLTLSENQKQETERKAAITSAVSEIPWKDAASKNLFLKAVASDIVRDDSGDLGAKVSDEFIPLAEYIKSQAESMPNLLAPKGEGGSGARGGKSESGKGSVNLSDIGLSMTADQRKAAQQQIANLLKH